MSTKAGSVRRERQNQSKRHVPALPPLSFGRFSEYFLKRERCVAHRTVRQLRFCPGQDDTIDLGCRADRGFVEPDGIPDCLQSCVAIPTVSQWGMIILALLLVIGTKVAFRGAARRRVVA